MPLIKIDNNVVASPQRRNRASGPIFVKAARICSMTGQSERAVLPTKTGPGPGCQWAWDASHGLTVPWLRLGVWTWDDQLEGGRPVGVAGPHHDLLWIVQTAGKVEPVSYLNLVHAMRNYRDKVSTASGRPGIIRSWVSLRPRSLTRGPPAAGHTLMSAASQGLWWIVELVNIWLGEKIISNKVMNSPSSGCIYCLYWPGLVRGIRVRVRLGVRRKVSSHWCSMPFPIRSLMKIN